ncbi:MAG: hypothetical protein Q4P66_02935 [Actinomycetaceae bacterium]|nr:hypothetical protein [Actinomycetaceae bacterium]
MSDDLKSEMQQCLDGLVDILTLTGETFWRNQIERYALILLAAPDQEVPQQLLVMLSWYGGMGSFNDLVLPPHLPCSAKDDRRQKNEGARYLTTDSNDTYEQLPMMTGKERNGSKHSFLGDPNTVLAARRSELYRLLTRLQRRYRIRQMFVDDNL